MKITKIVPLYTSRNVIALRTDPPITEALAREFNRQRQRDYPGTIEARSGLLILQVEEIKYMPNDRKGKAIPIILARELTDAEERLAKTAEADMPQGESSAKLTPQNLTKGDVGKDRTRYMSVYSEDLGLPIDW